MPKGFGCMFVGTEGIGKTSLALQFPQKIDCFSMSETGAEDLIELGYVDTSFIEDIRVKDFEQLRASIKGSTAKTIVLDSVSGLQNLVFNYCCRKDYGGDYDEFLNYYKGPRQQCPQYIDSLMVDLEEKRREGIHVILLAHSKIETIRNPKGLDYTSLEVDADEGIRSVIKKFMANILFMDLDPGTERVTRLLKGKAIEAKMKDEDLRVFYTCKSLTHTAKNKLNLPLVIPMGDAPQEAYTNLISELPSLYKDAL